MTESSPVSSPRAKGQVRETTLPPAASSAAAARRLVREASPPSVPQELLETIELLVSEVVTNAVVHAQTECRLRIQVVECAQVRVEVHDGACSLPPLDGAAPDAFTGRGLGLVEALADRWGSRPAPGGGKTVWFEASQSY